MIFWLIAVFSLLGVLTDIYIYRRVVRRHNLGRFFKSAYLVTAIAIDLVVVVALLFHRSSTDADSNVLLRATMWGIGLFFLNFVPKFIYTVISLGDYVVQRFTRRTSHWFGYLGAGLALVAACTLLWGLTWGRTLIRVEEVELEFENLPASFDGTRVVHFTDVHIGSMMCPDRMLEKLVKHINDLKPDIVVNSGDLVNSRSTELDAGKMATLSGIESTYGVFSILGNHDLGMYIRNKEKYPPRESIADLVARERTMGWNILLDSTKYIHRGEDSIAIAGIGFPQVDHEGGRTHRGDLPSEAVAPTLGAIPDSLFSLVIIHAPQAWDDVLNTGKGDLTLAGHVHAMQMKFHFGKCVLSPAMLLYDKWSGLYKDLTRERPGYLYINDGIGYVGFPMRIGVRPELTVYVLRRKADKGTGDGSRDGSRDGSGSAPYSEKL